MFSALRQSISRSSGLRSFSTSTLRRYDVAKMTLVGTLIRDPEARTTKSEKEFVTYTVATKNYPPPAPDVNGDRPPATSTFHRVVSFQEQQNRYLKSLKKGSKVFVEANFELREPEPGADPSTPRGQRQIYLKHESIRVLSTPRPQLSDASESESF